MAALPPFDKECFFITPIGAAGSLDRSRADAVLKHIVRPAAKLAKLRVVRADQITSAGHITVQVVEHCVRAKVAVADLTNLNPNVFYELGLRHARGLPTVLISETSQLPFDIAQLRTIFFDHQDLDSASQCKRDLVEFLRNALSKSPTPDSPVAYVEALDALRQGTTQDRSMAALLVGMDKVLRQMSGVQQTLERLDDTVGLEHGGDRSVFEPVGNERLIMAWAAMALGLLGSDMRTLVMERLGFHSGSPRPAADVAEAVGCTVGEVNEAVNSAFSVWASESFALETQERMREFYPLWNEITIRELGEGGDDDE